MDIKEKVEFIKDLLEDKKGIDVNVLSVEGLTTIADSFVLATGTSTPHIKSLADEVEEKMREKGTQPLRIEGYRTAKWILIDYGDVIVHIFNEESRKFYSLEWLWADAGKDNGGNK
ncbi:MAG: ribosome silencing factor [Bacillota bacterium]|nr:ribosome silencing factor [Bacillota bacterium]